MNRRWLVSPAFDLTFFAGPALLTAAIALLLPPSLQVSPLGWLILVVGIDVTHVYATLFRTYLHPTERLRRSGVLWGLPVVVWVGAAMVYSLSAGLFWTVMAYMAVFHFIRQQAGFSALYRVVEGQSSRGIDARVERWAVQALCLWPVLWWHVHLPLEIDWFLPGDFIMGLPTWTLGPAGLLCAGLVGAHLVFRLRSRQWAWGRDLWALSTAASWWVGIVVARSDVAFTLTNVVSHGVPYVALVGVVGHREGTLRRLWPLVLVPLALALSEEALWDITVWQDHPQFFGAWSVPDWLTALAVPLLSVPQLTHYLLDGLIWKLGPDNAALRAAIVGTNPGS